MARQWRIEFEGALYHILSRGNERRDIFLHDNDRFSFLDTLGELSERFEVVVYAYVLMGNHYHLLIKTNRPNVSKSMQWFGATYTRRFNLRHARSGHLFQGRFKSIIVENDAYLTQLSCYIHRNPLRAGMVDRLSGYRWSSYPAYAYGKSHEKWLDVGLILSQFNARDKHRAYREKVQRYASEEKRVWDDLRYGFLLGTEDFVDRIKSAYLSEEPHVEIPQQHQVLKIRDPGGFLLQTARALNCDIKGFRRSATSRVTASEKDNRDLLIYLLWETGLYQNQEIGDLFGLTYSSISRRVNITKSRITQDEVFKQRFERTKSLIKM